MKRNGHHQVLHHHQDQDRHRLDHLEINLNLKVQSEDLLGIIYTVSIIRRMVQNPF